MSDGKKSTWVTDRDAVEAFVSKGWHAFWHGVQPAVAAATPAVEAALISVAKGAAASALAAQAQGADGHATLQAALKGGTDAATEQEAPLVSAGITIAGQQLGALAGLMAVHVQDGPPPPSPTADTPDQNSGAAEAPDGTGG